MSRSSVILALLIGLVIGGILSPVLLRQQFAPENNVVTRTDTVTIRDTVTYEKPVYLTTRITDTIRIVYPKDTIRVHDTIVMYREQRYYAHDRYQAWVSGIDPCLDSIKVFPETRYITRDVYRKPKRWGIGLQAGYCLCVSGGQIRPGPYIGVGVSYNLVRF